MRWVSVVVLLLSSAVSAQTLLVDVDTQTKITIAPNNPATQNQCGTLHTLNWTATLSAAPCSDLLLWVTAGSCGDGPGAADLDAGDFPQSTFAAQGKGSVQFNANQLPLFLGNDGGVTCGSTSTDQTFNVCGSYKYSAFNCSAGTPNFIHITSATPPQIEYKSSPPGVPTLNGLGSLDGALSINATLTNDTSLLDVQGQVGDGGFTSLKVFNGLDNLGVVSGTVPGLTNGTAYQIRVVASDAVGNTSAPSAIAVGTPLPTLGFFGIYKRDGGKDMGGCSVTGGGLGLGLCLLLGAWRRSRR